jgi:hypothetical protein
MKRLIAGLMTAAFAVALPAAAGVNQMDPAKGSFHKKHAKAKVECTTCHDAKVTDVLVVEQASARSPGPINRTVCLGCHQSPAKPTWYGAPK